MFAGGRIISKDEVMVPLTRQAFLPNGLFSIPQEYRKPFIEDIFQRATREIGAREVVCRMARNALLIVENSNPNILGREQSTTNRNLHKLDKIAKCQS